MSEEEEEQLLRANTTMPMFDREEFNNWKPEWTGMPEFVQPDKMAFISSKQREQGVMRDMPQTN